MRTLFLVPRVRSAYPTEVRLVLARRRHATLTGRCACGAALGRDGAMAHEPDCLVDDASLAALLLRHGISRADLEFEAVVADAPAALALLGPLRAERDARRRTGARSEHGCAEEDGLPRGIRP